MYKLTPAPHNFGVSLRVALLSFVFAGFTLPASGQIGNVTNNTSTPTPGLGHDFIHMLNETVNPANGSVSVRVQVPVPKSRGITLPFAFAYDSNGAHFIANGGDGGRWRSNLGYLSQGGWSYAMPLLGLNGFTDTLGCDSEGLNCYKCDYFSTYLFQDSSGARHDLNMAVLTGSSDPSCTAPGYSPYPPYLAGGDEFFFSSMSQSGLTVNISDLDGTSYNFNENYMHPVAGSSALSSLPSVVEDRNGNKTVINDSGGGAFSVTDSLGRAAFSSSGFGASGNTLSVSGFTQPYRLSWVQLPRTSGLDLAEIVPTLSFQLMTVSLSQS